MATVTDMLEECSLEVGAGGTCVRQAGGARRGTAGRRRGIHQSCAAGRPCSRPSCPHIPCPHIRALPLQPARARCWRRWRRSWAGSPPTACCGWRVRRGRRGAACTPPLRPAAVHLPCPLPTTSPLCRLLPCPALTSSCRLHRPLGPPAVPGPRAGGRRPAGRGGRGRRRRAHRRAPRAGR